MPPRTLALLAAFVLAHPAGAEPVAGRQQILEAVGAAYAAGDRAAFAAAAEALEAGLATNPQDAELRQKLGFLYLENLGEPGKAIPHLERVHAALPDDAAWKMTLAKAYRAAGRTNAANVLAPAALPGPAKAPPPRPSKLDAAVNTAYASGSEASFRTASKVLEAHLGRIPRDLPRRQGLAFILLEKLHDPRAALPHLEVIASRRPRDSAWRQMLAKAHEGAGDFEAAANAYAGAAELAPRDPWARYHQGRMLKKSGRTEDAREAYHQALALDPRNNYVRIEVARLHNESGGSRQAARMAGEIVRDDAANAGALTLLGDIHRADGNFPEASRDYSAALNAAPGDPAAEQGMLEIRKARRLGTTLAFYTFDDTDDLRQSGIFSYTTLLMTGPLRVSVITNERFFQKPPGETVERFESGLAAEYRWDRRFLVTGGVSHFKAQNLSAEIGWNAGVNFTPHPAFDAWISYRHQDPVNDSYLTADESFTQNILAGGFSIRPTRLLSASFTASTAEYSDDNTRRFALASVSWLASAKAAVTAKLEYEYLDYTDQRSGYSSPSNYTLLRPVVEFAPQITPWLKLHVRAELPYVFDEGEWGRGIVAGPRFTVSDTCEFGAAYMNFKIPGGQTTWSGEGFKVDLSCRF